MKVSVLIPTVDRPDYFRESFDSARRQTHADLEILVSDDTISRRNADYAASVAAVDPRVRVLPKNPNPGLYENYNYLIQHATGEAFGILDDDDRWLPEMVAALVRPLVAHPDVVTAFCDHWVISEAGVRLPDETQQTSASFGRAELETGAVRDAISLSMKGGISTVFALFRTSVFQRELFDADCAGAADLDYAIRAAEKGRVFYIGERMGEYRAHSRRTTATQTKWLLDGVVRTLQKHTFQDPVHTALRRSLLVTGYRREMLYQCTRDRKAWWQSFRQYRAAGGPALDPWCGLSLVLTSLPHPIGERVRDRLKQVRTSLEPASADDVDGALTPAQAEGVYRGLRRRVAAIVEAPFNRLKYGRAGEYLTLARRIPGWTTTQEAAALMQAVAALPRDPVIVEVGSFLGKSAVVLAGACRLKGSGTVHCVDPFDASGDAFSVTYYRQIAGQSGLSLRQRFEHNLDSANLKDQIEVHQGTAEGISRQWAQPIDMLYLDGDQSPEGARRAYESFAPFLRPGAVVAVHNSSDRTYHDGHDGNRRLAVEVIKQQNYTNVVWIESTVLATFGG